MKYKKPFMQEDLRSNRLIAILDVLMEADEPLTVGQIQYRLGRDRNLSLSREEIEALLGWGVVQPGATNAPVRPARDLYSDKWTVRARVYPTPEQEKAAGPPPFTVTGRLGPEHRKVIAVESFSGRVGPTPIKHIIWFQDGSNIIRYGTASELADRYGTAIKIEEV